MKTVLLYVRVSKNLTGKARSTEQQEEVLRREIAEEHPEWEIVGVVQDEGISASSFTTKERPGYLELQRRIAEDDIDIVAIYEFSRLTRLGPGSEFEALTKLFRAHDVRLFDNGIGRDLNMDNAEDMHYLENAASQAKVESARISKRVRRDMESRATKGDVHKTLGFGWKKVDGEWLLDDVAAQAIRDAVPDLLDGTANLTTIAKRWNASGLTTGTVRSKVDPTTGERTTIEYDWNNGKVRRVLLRPSLAGLRVFRKETLQQPGTWPTILDLETFARLKSVLSDPSRRMNTGTTPNHLLTGIAKCGVCGKGVSWTNAGRFDKVYRCPTGHVNRHEADVDKLVTEKLFEAIENYRADLYEREVGFLIPKDDSDSSDANAVAEHLAEVARLEKMLSEYRISHVSTGVPSMSAMLEYEKLFGAQIDQHRAEAERAAPNRIIYDFAMDAEALWTQKDLTENEQREVRRKLVRAAVEVTIFPVVGKRRNAPFDPEFVSVRFLGKPVGTALTVEEVEKRLG